MSENIVLVKAEQFSARIFKLAEFLQDKKQYVVADQILRSGTSIGANIAEGEYAASGADFINKLKIAEKEAAETAYWIRILKKGKIIDEKQYDSLIRDIDELQRLIGASLKTFKKRQNA